MKINKISLAIVTVAVAFAACAKMDEAVPAGGSLLESQVQETTGAVPTMATASFNGLYSYLGKPNNPMGGSIRPDCYGFIMITFCDDLEGADIWIPDSGYNWFSVCGELSSRNADYRNPAVRYKSPYDLIGLANTFIASIPADATDESLIYMRAQAYALRAYSYMRLAINFQFGPTVAQDALCVPIVTLETPDFTHNPRATTKEVYEQIVADLTLAVNDLEGYKRPDASRIDKSVALGLRARAYQALGEWEKCYEDATAAIELASANGIKPKTVDEIKKSLHNGTAFESIKEHDWMWGYDMTDAVAASMLYANSSSWLRSFSAYAYAAASGVYSCINSRLWNKIAEDDIRKQWWVDADLNSVLLDGLTWDGHPDVANYEDGGDSKLPFIAGTNVKFGCNPIGTRTNEEDFPFMRIDEMYLIQAEAKAMLKEEGAAQKILTDYLNDYRFIDKTYSCNATGQNLIDEIWFQRRVELWGEGFFTYDMKRLGKPLVRFGGEQSLGNFPDAFRFNLAADDPWLNMRFPQGELDTNKDIVDNTGGQLPSRDQNPDLKDGVTD